MRCIMSMTRRRGVGIFSWGGDEALVQEWQHLHSVLELGTYTSGLVSIYTI